jgi:hypothetical protein
MGPGELAALGAIAFAGALVFGLTGFGSALITIPLASHFVPLPFALALFALADLVSAFGVGLENPRNAVRAEWTRLVPMILAGTGGRGHRARQPAASRRHAAPGRVRALVCALQPREARRLARHFCALGMARRDSPAASPAACSARAARPTRSTFRSAG